MDISILVVGMAIGFGICFFTMGPGKDWGEESPTESESKNRRRKRNKNK